MTQHDTTNSGMTPLPTESAWRILVIDDDTNIREMAHDYLSDRLPASTVLAAADGLEGVAVAKRLKPHLVISDYNLPGMDGLETCRRIGEAFPAGTLRFIVVTGSTQEGIREQILGNGIDRCLIKPFTLQQLYEASLELLPVTPPGTPA